MIDYENMSLLTQIEELIQDHQFEHFYLYKNLLKTLNNNYEINAKWLIGDKKSWILGFCANFNYQIYGVNFTQELLDTMIQNLDFNVIPNGQIFSGNKQIWDYIISKNPKVSFSIIKNRYFYEVDSERFIEYNNKSSNVRLANMSDTDTLAYLHCDFFREEYQGENNKEFLEMRSTAEDLIINQKVIVADFKDRIVGYCSRMDTEFDNEMVGTVYVARNFRENKIGKSLLSHMTKSILKNNPKSLLLTDMNNIASNKLVKSLGYLKVFEHTSGEIKKSVANTILRKKQVFNKKN